MKKKIILLIVLSLFTLTGCNKNVKKEEKQENIEQTERKDDSFNYLYDADKLPIKEITLNDTSIKNDLEMCKDINVKAFKNNIIYGECLNMNVNNIILETEGLFTYDINTKKLNYYKYNNKKRIWDYIIMDDYIYYIELAFANGSITWEFKKANLSFKTIKNYDKGTLIKTMGFPYFVENTNSDDLYVTITSDEENEETTAIYKLENDSLESVVLFDRSQEKETGKLINNFKINGNKLIYNDIYPYNKDKVIEMNLNTKETKEIYSNDELNDWNLLETEITDNYYILSYAKDCTKGKIVVIDSDNNVTMLDCDGNKSIDILDNETAIVSLGDYYFIFSLKDKEFIYKYNISTSDYNPTIFIDDETLVVTNKDEEIKYASLK